MSTETTIQTTATEALGDLDLDDHERSQVAAVLEPLLRHHRPTFEHCIRVGRLAERIGQSSGFDAHKLLIAGLVHDCGKAHTPLSVLACTGQWTKRFDTIIRRHVISGYRMLLAHGMNEPASIMLWHHKFQANPYPVVMPADPAGLDIIQLAMAPLLGHMVAIADTFDALHRRNDKFDHVLSEDEIRTQMLRLHASEEDLIRKLYADGVFQCWHCVDGMPCGA
jgi:putative nucleotidyltransferase with HDIG domain